MTTIIIDESTETGKSLMNVVRAVGKSSKNIIKIYTESDMEDLLLGKIMEDEKSGEYATRKDIMEALGE